MSIAPIQDRQTTCRNGRKTLYRDPNLRIIFGVTLMAVLGVSSITPAFPTIIRELAISSREIGLLITVFTFPGVILAPLMGIFADRIGRKKILVPSLMLFGIAGSACALVRDFNVLLAVRFLQGIGASALGSLNIAIIGDLYSGRDRDVAMGYNASVLSMGTASYPAIGGALTMVGWHYPFLLALIAVPVGFFVLFSLHSPEPRNNQHIVDYLRSVWRCINDRRVYGLFAAGVVTFVILYGAYLTYFPVLIGLTFEAPPVVIGFLLSGMSLTTALTASQLGRLSRTFEKRILLMASFSLYAVALCLIPLMSTLWMLVIPTIVFGIAHGMTIPSIQTLLAGIAPIEYRAAFMSINGMVLRIGQTIGPLLMGMIFVAGGIGSVFYAGAAFAVGMVTVVAILVR